MGTNDIIKADAAAFALHVEGLVFYEQVSQYADHRQNKWRIGQHGLIPGRFAIGFEQCQWKYRGLGGCIVIEQQLRNVTGFVWHPVIQAISTRYVGGVLS